MSLTRTFAEQIGNYNSPQSVGSRLRKNRVAPLLAMIEEVAQEHQAVKIIDIGGTRNYWNIVSEEFLCKHNVQITIVNLPGSQLPNNNGLFSFVQGNGCNLSEFADKSFDIAHSNSVIEHVGDWNDMVQFSKEVSRLANRYFVQTPNFWFPIEPHFMTPVFHWLPVRVRMELVYRFQLGHRKRATSMDAAARIVDGVHLLNKRQFQSLFQNATVITERFLLLPKSFIAVKN